MMKLKKSLTAFTALATTAALALLPVLPAQAAPSEDLAVTSARSFLETFGADAAVQERLISTYLAGGTWDSMSGASEPVSVREYSAGDGDYRVSTYEDGSIAVSRFETPRATGAIQSRGISGCTVSGTSRNNCKIDMWVGLVACRSTPRTTSATTPSRTHTGLVGQSAALAVWV